MANHHAQHWHSTVLACRLMMMDVMCIICRPRFRSCKVSRLRTNRNSRRTTYARNLWLGLAQNLTNVRVRWLERANKWRTSSISKETTYTRKPLDGFGPEPHLHQEPLNGESHELHFLLLVDLSCYHRSRVNKIDIPLPGLLTSAYSSVPGFLGGLNIVIRPGLHRFRSQVFAQVPFVWI